MTLVKQLKQLFPQFKVELSRLELCKNECQDRLNYTIIISQPECEIFTMKQLNIQLDANYIIGWKCNEKYKLKAKNKPPNITLATTHNYTLLCQFNFNALIEFIKAHQGEWCKLENITQTSELYCKHT
jgi:hypothetical protein